MPQKKSETKTTRKSLTVKKESDAPNDPPPAVGEKSQKEEDSGVFAKLAKKAAKGAAKGAGKELLK
jgi:hypothetical protein